MLLISAIFLIFTIIIFTSIIISLIKYMLDLAYTTINSLILFINMVTNGIISIMAYIFQLLLDFIFWILMPFRR